MFANRSTVVVGQFRYPTESSPNPNTSRNIQSQVISRSRLVPTAYGRDKRFFLIKYRCYYCRVVFLSIVFIFNYIDMEAEMQ